jgi:Family of unknown function (DUF5641)
VKSFKRYLQKSVGRAILSFPEIAALFVTIKGILNERPLCVRQDCEFLEPLAPSHLLLGRSGMSNYEDVDDRLLKALHLRFPLINQLQNRFWTLWKEDYMSTLGPRRKWFLSGVCPF